MKNHNEAPSLDIINDLEYGVWKATALRAALELDVFTVIARGYSNLERIAAATNCSERGMRILLDALCPLGLLSKSHNEYSLTPPSEAFLVRDKPTYYGDWCLKTRIAWEIRGEIIKEIKTGKVVGFNASQPYSADLWMSKIAPSILTWKREAAKARKMWEQVDLQSCFNILDVACGDGVKSFTLAHDNPHVQVTAFDFEEVLTVTARVAEAMGVTDRVTFRSGDIRHADFGTEEFDIVLFGLILFFFNPVEVADILQRAHKALKPGRLVVIHAPIADEERCCTEAALMLDLHLFMFMEESTVYTFSEYKTLLEKEGFTTVTKHNDFLVSARKQE